MYEGQVKFYVDDIECPNTSGVGIDAKGGVFNCNLEGWTFRAVCTEVCAPNMFVMEIGLWTETALSVDAEYSHLDGNIEQTTLTFLTDPVEKLS